MAHTDRPSLISWSMVDCGHITLRGHVSDRLPRRSLQLHGFSLKRKTSHEHTEHARMPRAHTHTHTCWHTWLQLTCRSRGPPESTGVVSSVKITFSLTSQSLGQGGFIPADAIYGTACVCPVSTWGVFNIYLRRGQSSYSVKYRSVQGLERSYTITAPVLHRKRVGQVRRQIHSGDFVVYNNLWLIGEYCRTRKKVPFWLQFCVKIILFPSFYSCFLYTGSERDEVIKLIKKVPVSTFSRRIIFEWVSAVICFQEDHVGI